MIGNVTIAALSAIALAASAGPARARADASLAGEQAAARANASAGALSARVVPLEQGSNFRDIGGYATLDGKRVRRGLIYRSGATPMLTAGDLERVRALGLRNMIDLRSSEERVLAPTRIEGVPYTAVGYSIGKIVEGMGAQGNGGQLYRHFPTLLAPQLRVLFGMLERGEGPLVYNCSAGQDRAGFTTAMVLSALGVPRATILADYHLSTELRRPQFEMPAIDPAQHPGSPLAQLFARHGGAGPAARAEPLYDPDGTPFLASAFDEIDARWGSVEAYLDAELGVDAVALARLRATYLE